MKKNYRYFVQGDQSLIFGLEKKLGPAEISIFQEPKLFSKNSILSLNMDDVLDHNIPFPLEDFPPVDAEIISKMRDCEAIFLKQADRFLSSCYQERKDRYLQYLRTWNHLLDEGLDFAIFRNIPHEGYDYIVYCLCKLKGIQTFCLSIPPTQLRKQQHFR